MLWISLTKIIILLVPLLSKVKEAKLKAVEISKEGNSEANNILLLVLTSLPDQLTTKIPWFLIMLPWLTEVYHLKEIFLNHILEMWNLIPLLIETVAGDI